MIAKIKTDTKIINENETRMVTTLERCAEKTIYPWGLVQQSP